MHMTYLHVTKVLLELMATALFAYSKVDVSNSVVIVLLHQRKWKRSTI